MSSLFSTSSKAARTSQQPTMVCPLCRGLGGRSEERTDPTIGVSYTYEVWVVCPCTVLKHDETYLSRWWPDLIDVPVIPADPEVVARLSKTVRVTARWSMLAPHLRAALLDLRRRNRQIGVACYRDSELASLEFADRTARSFADKDVERIDEDANLIVIRTGFLAKSNAGVAMSIARLVGDRLGKTTRAVWIVDDPSAPLGKGHKAWTPELATALDELDHDVWGTP